MTRKPFNELEPHVEVRVFTGDSPYPYKCRLAKNADGTPATYLEVYLEGMWCTISQDDPHSQLGHDSWELWS